MRRARLPSGDQHALARGQCVVLDHVRGPERGEACVGLGAVRQVNEAAVGISASAMTCLAKDFEPSIMAAAASGPKQVRPFSRSASAAPATSGASGPMTTRSGPSLRARARI